MGFDLTDTTASQVNGVLTEQRHRLGSPAVGMVLTLVIVTDESSQEQAVRAANEAGREHPSRVLAVVPWASPGSPRLDAEVRVSERGPGETVLLRPRGRLGDHADSVVAPLLVPDTPVVTWWPGPAPRYPAGDPLGALAQRRITDAAAAAQPVDALTERAESYRPGDTDLAWTRLTPWRGVLAAALDQPYDEIRGGSVAGAPDSPSAVLLARWLAANLAVPVERVSSPGPGIAAVRLETAAGPIAVTRPQGRLATVSRPGQPDRTVALHRRPIPELLAEELRHLDADEPYADAVQRISRAHPASPAPPEPTPGP